MERGKISVIVTAYNVEKYLGKCIDSILNQEYMPEQIIIVDDGSKDSTAAIADRYADNYPIVNALHLNHAGVSAARNAGLEAADTDNEFVAFVDGDDFIRPQMYKRMIEGIEENNADMIICNYDKVSEDGNEVLRSNIFLGNECVGPKEALKWMHKAHYWSYIVLWPRLYRRDVFKELRFPQGIIHEDEFLAHKIYLNCERIATIEDSLYCYRSNPHSIITSNPNDIKHIDEFDAFYFRFKQYVELGYIDLLRGTLERAKHQLKNVNHFDVTCENDQARVDNMIDHFREMVRESGKEAGGINRLIAVSPKLFYRIKAVLKKEGS